MSEKPVVQWTPAEHVTKACQLFDRINEGATEEVMFQAAQLHLQLADVKLRLPKPRVRKAVA
jgi:hypothetical protein